MSGGPLALLLADNGDVVNLYFHFDPAIRVWNRRLKQDHSSVLWSRARQRHPGLPENLFRDRHGRPLGGDTSVSLSYAPGVAVLGLDHTHSLGVDIELANRTLSRTAVEASLGSQWPLPSSDLDVLKSCMSLEAVFKALGLPGSSLRSVANTDNRLLPATCFALVAGRWILAVSRVVLNPTGAHGDENCFDTISRLELRDDFCQVVPDRSL